MSGKTERGWRTVVVSSSSPCAPDMRLGMRRRRGIVDGTEPSTTLHRRHRHCRCCYCVRQTRQGERASGDRAVVIVVSLMALGHRRRCVAIVITAVAGLERRGLKVVANARVCGRGSRQVRRVHGAERQTCLSLFHVSVPPASALGANRSSDAGPICVRTDRLNACQVTFLPTT